MSETRTMNLGGTEVRTAEARGASRRQFVLGATGLAGAVALSHLAAFNIFEAGATEASDKTGETGEADTGATSAASDSVYSTWENVLAEAKGQEVSWYGWGGDDARNRWIETVLAPRLKERYDVTLNLVGMDINDILTQLSGEKQAGASESAIDFIWINGENFATARDNGFLWGPFTQYLPSFNQYVDAEAADIAYDFGSAVEGYEAPYAKAQMCMWVDGAQIADVPKTPEEFLEFCKAHKGMVTYPEPGDFTGTAFISCLIAGVIGKEEFEKLSQMADATVDEVREIIEPGLEYLRTLNPYLWKEGTTFPASSTTVGQMYADGELVMNMGYGDPQSDVDNGLLPQTTTTFLFETGTVGNTNYMAIADKAPHKAAAMVAINEVMCPEMQLDQYETLGNITVLDLEKLPEDQREAFEAVELGSAQVALEDKLAVRVAEAAGPVIPLIEQLWLDEVPGK